MFRTKNVAMHDDRMFLKWLETLKTRYEVPVVLGADVFEAAIVDCASSSGEVCRGDTYRQTLSALRGAE